MLLVVGSSSQAIATAAFAACHSGQTVALDPAGGQPPFHSEDVEVRFWDGRMSTVQIVAPRLADQPDALIVFARPKELHDNATHIFEKSSPAPVLYAPSTFGGWAALIQRRPTVDPGRTGVLAGFPAVGDVETSSVTVRGYKAHLPCGSTHEGARALVDVFDTWLPGLVPTTAAAAELNSTNVLLHGPLLLPHLTQMARTGGEPDLFYRPPALTCGALLAEAVDRERVELGGALGLSLPSGLELLLSFYGDQGMAGRNVGEALNSFDGFASSRAPSSFDHRYVTDDVGFGLACWAALGSIVGVPMPVTSALVEILSRASRLDLHARASDLADSFLQAHRNRNRPTGRMDVTHGPKLPAQKTYGVVTDTCPNV